MKSAKQNVLSLAGQKRKYYDSALESGTGPSASGRREKRKKTAFTFVN
jgi:hypothetical protein